MCLRGRKIHRAERDLRSRRNCPARGGGRLHHGARGSALRLARLHLLHLQDHPPEDLDGCLRKKQGRLLSRSTATAAGSAGALTWFSLAEDSRNVAFHESARALPSSKLIILQDRHVSCVFVHSLCLLVPTSLCTNVWVCGRLCVHVSVYKSICARVYVHIQVDECMCVTSPCVGPSCSQPK